MAKKSSQIYPFSLRIPDELKSKLDSAASNSGRSLTVEILSRLNNSFSPLRSYSAGELIDELTERLKDQDIYLRIGSAETYDK